MKSNDVSDIPKLLESIQQKAVEKYKKEHGWIPITERMPKEWKDVRRCIARNACFTGRKKLATQADVNGLNPSTLKSQ